MQQSNIVILILRVIFIILISLHQLIKNVGELSRVISNNIFLISQFSVKFCIFVLFLFGQENGNDSNRFDYKLLIIIYHMKNQNACSCRLVSPKSLLIEIKQSRRASLYSNNHTSQVSQVRCSKTINYENNKRHFIFHYFLPSNQMLHNKWRLDRIFNQDIYTYTEIWILKIVFCMFCLFHLLLLFFHKTFTFDPPPCKDNVLN